MVDRDVLRQEIRTKSELSYSRSGGPGGQNVNKRDTKVTAKLRVSDLELPDPAALERLRLRLGTRINSEDCIVVQAETTRSQGRNREEALERMEGLIWTALRPDPRPRKATRPSRAARERRLQSKKRHGALKAGRRRPDAGED